MASPLCDAYACFVNVTYPERCREQIKNEFRAILLIAYFSRCAYSQILRFRKSHGTRTRAAMRAEHPIPARQCRTAAFPSFKRATMASATAFASHVVESTPRSGKGKEMNSMPRRKDKSTEFTVNSL